MPASTTAGTVAFVVQVRGMARGFCPRSSGSVRPSDDGADSSSDSNIGKSRRRRELLLRRPQLNDADERL
jgi:hypothetical protein